MSALTTSARKILHASGITAGIRYWYRNGVRILMYHRFPAGSMLEAQCEHLKRYYSPLSLTEAAELLARVKPGPRGAVVVTVDDGYRDFLTRAWPVMKAFSIPALIYVATDLPDHNTWLWTDQLTQFLKEQGDHGSAATIKERLKKVPDDKRHAYLDSIPGLRFTAPPSFEPLSWDDIRALASEGVEFGAHTRSHPILSRLPDRKRMLEEIGGSKDRLERELSRPVLHFCYPNGTPDDFNSDVIGVVRECGFRTAVTAVKGINYAGADPFLLRRIHQEPTRPLLSFEHEVAGLYR